MKTFLQAAQAIFVACLAFGSFSLWRHGADSGFYTRVFDWSLFGVGAVGCAIWTVFGLWQKPDGGGGIPRNCPKCSTALPMVRIPKTKREMLWGGVTCPKCGLELDRTGKEINATPTDPTP